MAMSLSFRALKTDIDPRKFIIKRWKSIPKQEHPVVSESDVRYRDSKGRTLLYFAAKNGETETVKRLLKSGSNPKTSDCDRTTPLHVAVDGGHHDIIYLLIEYGCKINARNILGQTALMKAVLYNDIEAVDILYHAGGYLDLTDCTGKTALLLAMQDCHEEIAAYLIKNGCDVNAIDYMGQSALFIAYHGRDDTPTSLGRKLVQAGYNFEHDKEWISKNLHSKLTEEKGSFASKIKRRLSFQKAPRKKKSIEDRCNGIELQSKEMKSKSQERTGKPKGKEKQPPQHITEQSLGNETQSRNQIEQSLGNEKQTEGKIQQLLGHEKQTEGKIEQLLGDETQTKDIKEQRTETNTLDIKE